MVLANSPCFCCYWRSFSIFLFTFRAVHLSRICSSTLTHALCFLGAQFRFMPHVSHIRDSACWLHVHQLAFVFVFNRTYAWVVIMQSADFIIACMLCRADRSFRMRTCHFAALLIFLTKVSFEASKFASYYPSCFVVRVVAALFDFLLLKFVVPNMKRKSIFLGLLDAGLSITAISFRHV